MKPEDIKLLNNFLNNEEVIKLANNEVKKLAEKVEILAKQAILMDQYNKEMQELYDKLDKICQ